MKEDQCRVCLNEEGIMLDIFEKEDKLMISTKIMFLANVRIYHGDGLPALICTICRSKLNSCIEFIRLCEASDMKLRATVSLKNEVASCSETENYDTATDNGKAEKEKKANETANVNSILKKVKNTSKNVLNKGKKRNFMRKEIKLTQQCNICGRVMSSRHRLKTHLVTHSGERPFSCSFCNKNFSLEANLKVHLRVHTGEKPFQCPICGESFGQSSGLIAHKRKHTGQLPYKCVLCPRSFRTIGHLQYHTKWHTGEKSFGCDKCGHAFITRGDLNQHLATHSGERAHVCSVCGLRLTRASNLKRHMQQLHNGATGMEDSVLVPESNS